MKRFTILLLSLCLLANTALAETLTIYGMEKYMEQAFVVEHPGVIIERWDYELNHTDITRRLVNGEMKADVMQLITDRIDVKNLAKKGYLLELSVDAYLLEQVERMYQPLRDAILQDGKLYAIPRDNYVRFFAYDPAGWEAAGYAEEDVPDSFPALLSFLESWCDRVENDPVDNVRVYAHFAPELYSEISYTRWLTELLLEQHILQTDYAGEPLRFGGTFLELLKRIETLGQRLFNDEPRMVPDEAPDMLEDTYSLFTGNVLFIQELPHAVGLRLHEDDPILIRGVAILLAVPAASGARELAVDYLALHMRALNGEVAFPEPYIVTNYQHDAVSILRDVEPIESESARENHERWLQEIESMRRQLASGELSIEERVEMEDLLARYEQAADRVTEESFYVLSPGEIALWQQYGDSVYYPGPSAFDLSGDASQNVEQLLEQFYHGRLTAEQLCSELDRLAQMIEMERQ